MYFDTYNGNAYRYTSQINRLFIKLVKEMSEKLKSIAGYNIRNVGLPYALKCIGNGATIKTDTKGKLWYLVKSSSQLLQNTSSNLCCHWTHTDDKFSYRISFTKAHPFSETEWKDCATVPVDSVNFQKNWAKWKGCIKKFIS